jgi:dipeptidyl aminopeptidase/acylaminoacyl peptidase
VFNIFSKAPDGIGEAVRLSNHTDGVSFPRSYLPDGSGLLFQHRNNIGILHLAPEPREEILLGTPFGEIEPSLSPDGRWLAYVSNQSGRREVYVQPFPRGDNRWAVSNEGGSEPAWSRNGGELFYRNGDRMMAVAVSGTSELRLGTPSVLFEGHYEIDPFGNDARNYDVSPDGRRFLMIRREVDRDRPQQQLNIVVNWFQELRELDPNR